MGTKVLIDYRIFKQPNGLYLYFGTNACCPIAYDLSEIEVMCMILNVAKERGLEDIEHASDLKECKNLFAPVNITQRQFYDILRECKKPVEKDPDNENNKKLITEQDLLDAKDYIRLALGVRSGLEPKDPEDASKNDKSLSALRVLEQLVDKEMLTSTAKNFDVSTIVNKETGGTYDDSDNNYFG